MKRLRMVNYWTRFKANLIWILFRIWSDQRYVKGFLLHGFTIGHSTSNFNQLWVKFPPKHEWTQIIKQTKEKRRSTRYSDRLHDFSVNIPRCYKDVYVNSFFPCTARLWNSLPVECFPLTCDLSGFKSRINRYLLTVGFF